MSASGPVRKAKRTRADWYTPQAFFDGLDQEFHFTIDGAASKENFMVNRYYSLDGTGMGDALTSNPVREVIFLNPPYGNLKDWIGLCEKWARGCPTEEGSGPSIVVALFPNNTDTGWFKQLFSSCAEIRFVYPRLAFVHPGTQKPAKSPAGGNMVVIWREPKPVPGPRVSLIGVDGMAL